MQLPKCVKVDLDDKRSRDHLESESWRLVGALVTYRGRIHRQNDSRVDMCRGESVLELAAQIEWHGRLWKDPEISEDDRWKEMREFLQWLDSKGNTELHVYRMVNAAFIVCSVDRVHLIGVHPAAAGLGLAAGLIRSRFDVEVTAGTYSDNDAAKNLYKSLDMKVVKQQAVFHK